MVTRSWPRLSNVVLAPRRPVAWLLPALALLCCARGEAQAPAPRPPIHGIHYTFDRVELGKDGAPVGHVPNLGLWHAEADAFLRGLKECHP